MLEHHDLIERARHVRRPIGAAIVHDDHKIDDLMRHHLAPRLLDRVLGVVVSMT